MSLSSAGSTIAQTLLLVLLGLAPLAGHAADAPRSLSDCQGISDSAARLQCYDALTAPARPAVPDEPRPGAATRSRIPAPRPAVVAPPSAAADVAEAEPVTPEAPAVARGAAAQRQPEKSLLQRLVPFGWGTDATAEATEPDDIEADEPAPQVAGSAAVDFGRQPAAQQVTRDGVTELVDTIAALTYHSENRWQITLRSGQIWRQQITKSYFLEKGDPVRIRPSGWGNSYRLYSERLGGFIQVERIDD